MANNFGPAWVSEKHKEMLEILNGPLDYEHKVAAIYQAVTELIANGDPVPPDPTHPHPPQ